MSQTVELKVGMSCQGCVGAVKRVLGKLEGVESFDIDIEKQKVTVKGNVQPDVVFQTVSKTGKATSFWEAPPAEAPAATQPPAAEPPVVAQPPAAEPPAVAQPPAAEPPAVAQPPLAEPEQLPTETISAA